MSDEPDYGKVDQLVILMSRDPDSPKQDGVLQADAGITFAELYWKHVVIPKYKVDRWDRLMRTRQEIVILGRRAMDSKAWKALQKKVAGEQSGGRILDRHGVPVADEYIEWAKNLCRFPKST